MQKIYLKNNKSEEILPKSKWYMKFEKYWIPSESKAHEYLDNFVNKIINGVTTYLLMEHQNFLHILEMDRLMLAILEKKKLKSKCKCKKI